MELKLELAHVAVAGVPVIVVRVAPPKATAPTEPAK